MATRAGPYSGAMRAWGVAAVLAVAVSLPGIAAVVGETSEPEATPATVATSVRVEAAASDAVDMAAAEAVTEMSTRERAASIVMGHIATTDAAALREYMTDTGIGGFILMGDNVPSTEARLREVVAVLTVDAALPPLVAIDQEGGVVSRLLWDDFASPRALRTAPVAETAEAFSGRGSLVARAGVDVNFGIVADHTADAGSFIHSRVLGTTPAAAAERVTAAVRGEGAVVASTLKHFPGHGAAPGDSHRVVPTTSMPLAQWRQTDALPFVAGIDAGAELVMFGHLAYTAVDEAPASLSARWHEILRDDLGFDGIAVTDDLGMLQATGIAAYADPVANAVAAVVAGNDLVLAVMFTNASSAGEIVDGLVTAVDTGGLDAARLQEAAERVLTLRLRIAASGDTMLPCPDCTPVAQSD